MEGHLPYQYDNVLCQLHLCCVEDVRVSLPHCDRDSHQINADLLADFHLTGVTA